MLERYTQHIATGPRRRTPNPEPAVSAVATTARIGRLSMMLLIALPLLLLLTLAALALGGLLVALFVG